jgi:mRNA interferase RelE/StbE
MSFSIGFLKPVQKFVKKLDNQTKLRLQKGIQKLSDHPVPHDAVRVEGEKEKVFRIRVGDFRILYVIHYEEKEVTVFKIDKRSRVYD